MDPTLPTIQIVATPAGEAPEWVREAWIGLFLPLANTPPLPVTTLGAGVLSGQNLTWWRFWWLRLTRKIMPYHGYIVRFDEAMAVLRTYRPDAAAWWSEHVTHLTGSQFVFEVKICRKV